MKFTCHTTYHQKTLIAMARAENADYVLSVMGKHHALAIEKVGLEGGSAGRLRPCAISCEKTLKSEKIADTGGTCLVTPYRGKPLKNKEKPPSHNGSEVFILVGVWGFEPQASWTRTKRDTKLRHTPKVIPLYLSRAGMSRGRQGIFPA